MPRLGETVKEATVRRAGALDHEQQYSEMGSGNPKRDTAAVAIYTAVGGVADSEPAGASSIWSAGEKRTCRVAACSEP
jgi:hypothetical protein